MLPGAPIFTPRVGKHEQLADLHPYWEKYYVAFMNADTSSIKGHRETIGATTYNYVGLPASSFNHHDRAGGVSRTLIAMNQNNVSISYSNLANSLSYQGTPDLNYKILLPRQKRAASVLTATYDFAMTQQNGAGGHATKRDIYLTAVDISTGTPRTLGSVSMTEYSGAQGGTPPLEMSAVIRLASPADVAATERLCLSVDVFSRFTSSLAGIGQNTGSHSVFTVPGSSVPATYSAAHYEGFFSTINIEYVN